MIMKVELLLRKLSDFFSLSVQELGNTIVLAGGNIRIKFEGRTLHLETEEGELKIPEEQIEDFDFFSKTKHCKIKLRNGVMRIYPEEGKRFRFFVSLK